MVDSPVDRDRNISVQIQDRSRSRSRSLSQPKEVDPSSPVMQQSNFDALQENHSMISNTKGRNSPKHMNRSKEDASVQVQIVGAAPETSDSRLREISRTFDLSKTDNITAKTPTVDHESIPDQEKSTLE